MWWNFFTDDGLSKHRARSAAQRPVIAAKYRELCVTDHPWMTTDECAFLSTTYAAMNGALSEVPEILHDEMYEGIRDRARAEGRLAKDATGWEHYDHKRFCDTMDAI